MARHVNGHSTQLMLFSQEIINQFTEALIKNDGVHRCPNCYSTLTQRRSMSKVMVCWACDFRWIRVRSVVVQQ